MNEDKKAVAGWSRQGEACFNCGKALEVEQNFCSNCGQRGGKPIHFKAFLGEFLQDYFTFDSKIFRSLSPLLFKPGFLVNEFMEGRRVRYIPPLRVFLFSSILFFLFFGIGVGNSSEAVGRELDFFFDYILPKLVLLFLPVFAWLIGRFFGKGEGYLKHFLFSTYLHSFIFIVGVIYWLLSEMLQLLNAAKFNLLVFALFGIVILIYLWVALKRAYPKVKRGARSLRLIGIGLIYGSLIIGIGIVVVTFLLARAS